MNFLYKGQSQINRKEFARKNETRDDQDEISLANQETVQETEDPFIFFYEKSYNFDEFNSLDEDYQIFYLDKLSKSIENSLAQDETDYVQWICAEIKIPKLILEITQETKSIVVYEYALSIIFQWVRCRLDPDFWMNEELLIFLFINATSTSENMTSVIFEYSVQILIKLILNKEEILSMVSLNKIIKRIVTAMKKNQYIKTMELLSEFLDTIFIVIKDYDENDVLPLGDIFNTLSLCTNSIYFSSLMNCALNICKKSQKFAYLFVQNVDVLSIFSELSQVPFTSRLSIINMMTFFIGTHDQIILQTFMPKFQWSWIIPILKSPDNKVDPNYIALLVKELLISFPELAKQSDLKCIFEYFCYLINHNEYVNKLYIFMYMSEIFSIQNFDITKLLIENSYIEIASAYLNAAEGNCVVSIINSLHYMAILAETHSIPQIIERLAQNNIFYDLAQLSSSEDANISQAALAFLCDDKLTLVHPYLPSENP